MENNPELLELIRSAAAGSRRAFADLYDLTHRDVCQTVHFLVKDTADRDDVVQEIYIQLYKSLTRFDPNRPFRPWLIGLVMRQVSAYRTKRWMSFQLLARERKHAVEVQHDFAPDLVDKLDNRHLLQKIDGLPFRLKQVVVLRYLHDYSQDEVASILGVPVGTVKSRLHSALKRLRRSQQNSSFAWGKENSQHGH